MGIFPDPQQNLTLETLRSENARRAIHVPGPWQAQFEDLRDYSGVAWYRKQFKVDGRSGGQAAHLLHFGAVDYFATVWLNGRQVGEHEGGYLPFELDVTEALRQNGPNELVVRVIDPGNDADFLPEFTFAEIPHGKQSWYGPIGGIWQGVYLEQRSRHPRHPAPGDPGRSGRAGPGRDLHQPAGRTAARPLAQRDRPARSAARRHRFVLPAGKDGDNIIIPVPEPLLWDTTTPNLYELQAVLLDGRMIGPPSWIKSAPGSGCELSQLPPLAIFCSTAESCICEARGSGLLSRSGVYPVQRRRAGGPVPKAKHMGLNCLRTHIKITDPRYYDAADRIGLLIWTELPNWQELTEAAKRRAKETLFGMVDRDWNHPSIIIWTIVNENWGVDLAVNAGHRAWLADMYTDLKNLDPHRLVVGNSPCFTNFHVVTDIEDFHNYYAMPDHYKKWKEWVQTFASRPPWTFAHVYESIESWREYIRDPWNPIPRQPAPEVRRRGNEPIVVSEFGNWGLPDVDLLRELRGTGALVVRDRARVGRRGDVPHGSSADTRPFTWTRSFRPFATSRPRASGCSSLLSSTRSSRCAGIPALSGTSLRSSPT